MTPYQQAQFFSQLATLLDSGLTVPRSLEKVMQGCSPQLERQLNRVAVSMSLGDSFSTSLAQVPRMLDQWTIGLIQVAESKGALAEMCDSIAEVAQQQHRRHQLYRSVQLAGLTTLFCVLVLLAALVLMSRFSQKGLLSLGILIVLVSLVSPELVPRLPVVNRILTARSMLKLADLELPLNWGVPLLQALELMRDRLPRSDLSLSLSVALGQIPAGQTLSQSLEGRLPPIALQMIRTGEETGNLSMALHKLREYYDRELERTLRLLQGILIPVSLLAAGSVVVFLLVQALTSLLILLPD
ncbi:MAG: type II secretion system F family protein [Microcoleaceae cyanobacterium]